MDNQANNDASAFKKLTGDLSCSVSMRHFRKKLAWRRLILSGILLGMVVFGAGYIEARTALVGNALSSSASAASRLKETPFRDTPFLAHARQAGLKTCESVFPALGEVLVSGTQYNVQSDWDSDKPDSHAIRSLVGMEIKSANYTGSAAGVIFASPNGQGCEGIMMRVVPFPLNCKSLEDKLPRGSVIISNLGRSPVYALPDNGGQLLLVPSDKACVVISLLQATE